MSPRFLSPEASADFAYSLDGCSAVAPQSTPRRRGRKRLARRAHPEARHRRPRRRRLTRDLNGGAPSRERGVVRGPQIESHQADEGPDKALRLAQGKVEDRAKRERSEDGQARVPALPAWSPRGRRVPGLGRVVVKPDRDVASPAQGLVVLRPVRHPVLRLVLDVDLALLPRAQVLSRGRTPARSSSVPASGSNASHATTPSQHRPLPVHQDDPVSI